MAQDANGYIWLGTDRGLNRYNSYEYYQYFYNEGNQHSICNNSIQSLLIDHENKLWVGTKEGICIYDREKEQFNNTIIDNNFKTVFQILESPRGTVYANLGNAIYKYDSVQNTFYHLIDFDEYSTQNRCFADGYNRIWLVSRFNIKCYNEPEYKLLKTFKPEKIPYLIYSSLLKGGDLWTMHGTGGLKRFDTRSMEELAVPETILKHPVLSKALVTEVFEYSETQLLFITHKNGLFLFDKENNRILFQNDYEFPFEVPDCNITTLFLDTNDNLWIGSHEKGHYIIYKYKNQFNYDRHLQSIVKGNSVKTLALDGSKSIWFSTYGDELFNYNLITKKIDSRVDLSTFFKEDPFFQDKIRDLVIDNQNVWMITPGKFLHCINRNDQLIRTKTHFGGITKMLCQLTIDDSHNVWVCSESESVYMFENTSVDLIVLPVFDRNIESNSSILALSDGTIMVAATNQPIKIIDPKNNNKIYSLDNLIETTRFEPTTLYEDSQQNIWIGQMNGPLLKYVPRSNTIEKTPIRNATSIIEDDKHELWVGTSYGLSHYIPATNKQFTYYSYDGLGGNQFNIKCSAMLPDKSLIFGGTHGFTIFQPSSISINRKISLLIEDLKINNEYYYKTASNNKASKSISLKHNENNISIHYTALDISEYSRLRFYYKLEGYNADWIDAKNNRVAHFSNLKPGTYNFKLKITSNDYTSSESETSLRLIISRPPWFSIGALFIYGFIVLLIVYYIYKLKEKNRINRTNALIAKKEKEHEAFINQMNMSFFSNISHEFRTPLSVIKAPVNLLSKSSSLRPEEKSMVELVQRSIKRMLRLVNQLMDLSKLEADALKLKVTRADLTYQVKNTLEIFELPAKEKQIKLNYSGLEESFFMFIDIDKLEKVLANLLSNALKFTHENGEISVSVNIISAESAISHFPNLDPNYENYYALVEVKDTGIGIPEDKLESVFQRYYQIDDQKNATINWGTGIGLYFTKRLLNLHHGEIKASNNTEGGSTFSFVIPTAKNAYAASEVAEATDTQKDNENENIKAVTTFNPDNEQFSQDKDTILVVDDDVEIAYFLKNLLRRDYNVFTKYDGESALKNIDKISPSLIISDVLMPGMTGYELCREIKANINYCHIPVILLTAKTLLEEQIEGLETGANAYVTKPFEPEYIQAMVKSQLKNQKLLSQILTSRTDTNMVEENILSPRDKAFMSQLYELLENELSNQEINITVIAEKMNMSRTKFYHKMKALTGEKPNTFFNQYKLNRSAELLLTGDYTISEIADMIGFSSPAYFATCFKKQFDCKPSDYKG
nr:hybrid sensor histidine kinase/response regulator transcription factor [Mangrovibacterium lignilyticum]